MVALSGRSSDNIFNSTIISVSNDVKDGIASTLTSLSSQGFLPYRLRPAMSILEFSVPEEYPTVGEERRVYRSHLESIF
jgi:hypothetical protein